MSLFIKISSGTAFLVLFGRLFLSASTDFKVPTIVRIEPGASLRSVSLQFKQAKIIRSRLALEALVIIYGGEKHIIPVDYLFENKLPVYEVARRITKGESHIAPIVVTIPEGFDLNQIADAFAPKLANFNRDKFLLDAKNSEGYLFPDTYFFFSSADEKDVLESMSKNFAKKISALNPGIISSGRNEKQIIIMASIIEREAKGDVDRGFISGILWRRLENGMPLQVDAALETYKKAGLPKNPIANPGLKSLQAAVHPQSSPYLYYLHDKNGEIHYAKNFEEHLQNKLKYLR